MLFAMHSFPSHGRERIVHSMMAAESPVPKREDTDRVSGHLWLGGRPSLPLRSLAGPFGVE